MKLPSIILQNAANLKAVRRRSERCAGRTWSVGMFAVDENRHAIP